MSKVVIGCIYFRFSGYSIQTGVMSRCVSNKILEILGIICEMNRSMTIGHQLFRHRGNLDLENILATASLLRFLLARIPIMSFFSSIGHNVLFYSLLLEI